MGVGIYTEDENRFLFNNVIVGRTAKARFKLSNTNKVNIYFLSSSEQKLFAFNLLFNLESTL